MKHAINRSAIVFKLVVSIFAVVVIALSATNVKSYSSQNAVTIPAPTYKAPLGPFTHTLFMPLVGHQLPPDTTAGVEMTSISDAGGLSRMVQAGATWVRRAAVWWPDVEPTEGVYSWSVLSDMETEFTNAAAQNAQVILVVRGTPGWAQEFQPWSCGPIAQGKLSAFGDFMAALVSRYSHPPYSVKYYEIGNEEDADRALLGNSYNNPFGCWGDNSVTNYGGEYYAEMLKVVYPRIKQVDSSAQVVLGGLLLDCDPRNPPTGKDCKPARFLEGILSSGGGASFDGIAFHAYDYYGGALGRYGNPNFHSDSVTTGPVVIAKAAFIKTVLSAYGVTGKYLMNTESALLAGNDTYDPNYEQTKAYYIAQLYSSAHAIDLRANIWYRVFGWPGRGSALLNDDLSARPAYTAFQIVTTVLGGASYKGIVTSADVGGSANVRGYKFESSNQTIWLVWSADAKSYTLQLTQTPASVLDVLGNAFSPINTTSVALVGPDRLLAYLAWPR